MGSSHSTKRLSKPPRFAMVSKIASTTNKTVNAVELLEFFQKKSTSNSKDIFKMAIDVNHRINNPKEQVGLIDHVDLI